MTTTRDHAEIPEVRKVLNLDAKEAKTIDGATTDDTGHVEAPTPTSGPAPAPESAATTENVPA